MKKNLAKRAMYAISDGAIATGKFIQKHSAAVMICMMATMMIGQAVCAAPDGNAETMWSTLTKLITTWSFRLGGVVVFVGGIMFALGWKSDDAEQKTRGIQTVVAGAMVCAIAGSASIFLNYNGGTAAPTTTTTSN